mmetsp:Transcript_20111/g.36482  ORF Transcript_20111/g.36482 Transcript_20111/m.36482 type:complete len:226 (+) Transcript_20111:77-754(+)
MSEHISTSDTEDIRKRPTKLPAKILPPPGGCAGFADFAGSSGSAPSRLRRERPTVFHALSSQRRYAPYKSRNSGSSGNSCLHRRSNAQYSRERSKTAHCKNSKSFTTASSQVLWPSRLVKVTGAATRSSARRWAARASCVSWVGRSTLGPSVCPGPDHTTPTSQPRKLAVVSSSPNRTASAARALEMVPENMTFTPLRKKLIMLRRMKVALFVSSSSFKMAKMRL